MKEKIKNIIQSNRSWFKRGRPNELYLWNDVFNFGVSIIWPATHERMKKVIFQATGNKEFDRADFPIGGAKYYFEPKTQTGFIGIGQSNNMLRNLTHEAMHAVGGMLQIRGIHLNYQSEETYAYCMGWLVANAHPFLDKKR